VAIETWLPYLLTPEFRNYLSLPFKSIATILLASLLTPPLIHLFSNFTHVVEIPEFVFSSIGLSILVLSLEILKPLFVVICSLKALFKKLL
jgi:hypothetical protein